MEEMMGHLIGMTEQIRAEVEDNKNTRREGNKVCREATEACLEKMKAETDADP
jgi:hypothetical protein